MLPLDDPRWASLTYAYGIGSEVARLLSQPPDELDWDDLGSGICHQESVYTATYAAIPHLVRLAAAQSPEQRVDALLIVGYSVACAKLPSAPAIPTGIESSYTDAIQRAKPLILETLQFSWDEPVFRRLVGALASVTGYESLTFVLDGLDCGITCPECGVSIDPMKSDLNPLTDF